MKRKSLASTVAIALAASTVSLISSPAVAAGQNPYDTFDATVGSPAGAIVGVGSDTTQIVVHALTDAWNTSHTPKLSSFAADGNPTTVDLRDSADQAPINRSTINGSGNGKKLLFGATNNAEVNFARSSSTLNASEQSAGLQQAAFAVDGMKMAVSTTTNAPASITEQQVVDIYKGLITNWSQIDPAKSGTIKPYSPQTGSGTYSFFVAKLKELNGGTDVTFAGTVGVTQEHSPTEIQSDPNAIGPFSTARASGINTIQLMGGTEWKRAVYNVVRGADTTNADIAAAFGKDGFVCSAEGRVVIEEIGFVPLATEAQGGKCGVWTQAAVTDFTSFDDAGQTTTTLAGSASGGTVTLTATIGGLTTDGTVTFKEADAQVGSPVDVVAGEATLSLPGVAVGSHSYTAHFAPADSQLAGPSISTTVDVLVKKAATVTLAMSPYSTSQNYARGATATATVAAAGAPATGSVQFLRSGASLGVVTLTNGVATKVLGPTTPVGTYTITAKYLGTADTDAASASRSFAILRASSITAGKMYDPTIRASIYPVVMSQVKISGGVAGVYPTGSVRVYRGSKILGTKALVSGKANLKLAKLPVGKHTLRVLYLGSANVKYSWSTYFTVTVSR